MSDEWPLTCNCTCAECCGSINPGNHCRSERCKNPFVSPEQAKLARIEAAKRRGIPPLRRSPAKRPGFWRG